MKTKTQKKRHSKELEVLYIYTTKEIKEWLKDKKYGEVLSTNLSAVVNKIFLDVRKREGLIK